MIFIPILLTIIYIFIPSLYYATSGYWEMSLVFIFTSPIMFYVFSGICFLFGLLFTLFERKPKYRFTYLFIKSCLRFMKYFILFFKSKTIGKFPEIKNGERVIIIANHKSKLDPVLLYLHTPFDVSFTPKDELYKNKIVKYILDKIKCCRIDRSDIRQTILNLKNAKDNIKNYNTHYVVFPEGGTHNRDDEGLYNQKPAAYKIVLDTKSSILPITISNALNFTKHRRQTITIKCHDIIPYEKIKDLSTVEISNLLETIITSK